MNDSQTCCSHSRVVLKHTDYPGGTRSDYWECDSGCGTRFYPETVYAVREIRDKFASMAMMGMLCANSPSKFDTGKDIDDVIALEAYRSADAMILQRDMPT